MKPEIEMRVALNPAHRTCNYVNKKHRTDALAKSTDGLQKGIWETGTGTISPPRRSASKSRIIMDKLTGVKNDLKK